MPTASVNDLLKRMREPEATGIRLNICSYVPAFWQLPSLPAASFLGHFASEYCGEHLTQVC